MGWLAGSGLPLGDGVQCDAHCRVAPQIYAAGDVASWYNNHFHTRMRVEHRVNATEQAMAVAGNLLGDNSAYAPVPYFWSDQYDARIQAYGIFPPEAEMTVLQGDLASRRFVASYSHHGTVVGVLGWNSPRELRALRANWWSTARHLPGSGLRPLRPPRSADSQPSHPNGKQT